MKVFSGPSTVPWKEEILQVSWSHSKFKTSSKCIMNGFYYHLLAKVESEHGNQSLVSFIRIRHWTEL